MGTMNRMFRRYKREEETGKGTNPWQERNNAVDENHLARLAARDLEAEQRKDKKLVKAKRVVRMKDGKTKTLYYDAGILATRDHGSLMEKLRKAVGGKAARRVLIAERRAARENPEAISVIATAMAGDVAMTDGSGFPIRTTLERGKDFAIVKREGEPQLVIADDLLSHKLEVTYTSDGAAFLGAPR